MSRRIAQNYYNRSDYRRDSLTRTQCGLNEDSLGDHFHAGQLFLSHRDTAQPLFPRLSLSFFYVSPSCTPASTREIESAYFGARNKVIKSDPPHPVFWRETETLTVRHLMFNIYNI